MVLEILLFTQLLKTRFNMVDMSIKCIKNIKIVFELLLFIRINIIIPFSTVEEDNNGEVHWNEKDLAV